MYGKRNPRGSWHFRNTNVGGKFIYGSLPYEMVLTKSRFVFRKMEQVDLEHLSSEEVKYCCTNLLRVYLSFTCRTIYYENRVGFGTSAITLTSVCDAGFITV